MPMSARASSPTKSDSAADLATQIEPKRTVDILLLFALSLVADSKCNVLKNTEYKNTQLVTILFDTEEALLRMNIELLIQVL